MQLKAELLFLNLQLNNNNNSDIITIESQIFKRMKIIWLYCFISMAVIRSLLKYRLLSGQTPRVKQLSNHFQVIESKIPKSQLRKDVLVLIIRLIYLNSVCLYAEHLNFGLLIALPDCQPIILLIVCFIYSHLNNVQIFEHLLITVQ